MDLDRQRRAEERRRRAVLRKVGFDEQDDAMAVLRGPEALSLVTRLTAEGWSLSGRPWPAYDRATTPYRFVRGWPA